MCTLSARVLTDLGGLCTTLSKLEVVLGKRLRGFGLSRLRLRDSTLDDRSAVIQYIKTFSPRWKS